MSATKLTLPLPTNRTVRGPTFHKDAEKIMVEYDYEEDDGSKKSNVLVFSEILDFEFRLFVCCDASDILGPTEMLCFAKSERLETILTKWQESVGWQEFQAKQGGAERFKHFKLYFDDVGCINVIASGFRYE